MSIYETRYDIFLLISEHMEKYGFIHFKYKNSLVQVKSCGKYRLIIQRINYKNRMKLETFRKKNYLHLQPYISDMKNPIT